MSALATGFRTTLMSSRLPPDIYYSVSLLHLNLGLVAPIQCQLCMLTRCAPIPSILTAIVAPVVTNQQLLNAFGIGTDG
jgi:hypothetical protein